METELIRALISSYFNIVRETIADQVPKAVMHLLVNHSKDVVQNRLVSELYKEDLFGDLLYEDDGIKAEREKCEKLLGMFSKPPDCRLNHWLMGLPIQAPTGKLPRSLERCCREVLMYLYYA